MKTFSTVDKLAALGTVAAAVVFAVVPETDPTVTDCVRNWCAPVAFDGWKLLEILSAAAMAAGAWYFCMKDQQADC